jgi:cytochrome c peroxidase
MRSGENFGPMKSSMANLSVTGASITAVLAISLATAVEEDDVTLLKRAQELFQPLPKDMATPESPITKERVNLGQQLFFDPRLTPIDVGRASVPYKAG